MEEDNDEGKEMSKGSSCRDEKYIVVLVREERNIDEYFKRQTHGKGFDTVHMDTAALSTDEDL